MAKSKEANREPVPAGDPCEGASDDWRRVCRALRLDYGTQALIVQTLIELLVRKGILSEDDFEETLQEIDRRDGVVDGTLGLGRWTHGGGI